MLRLIWICAMVMVFYLMWVVYESPHLVWMERLVSSRANGACLFAMLSTILVTVDNIKLYNYELGPLALRQWVLNP